MGQDFLLPEIEKCAMIEGRKFSMEEAAVLGFRFFLSTVGADSAAVAREYGLGLEIADFCTAVNMEEGFSQWDAQVKRKLEGIPARVFHGPFNELFPCAIDPKARELAAMRYRQAIRLAKTYGAEKVVFHGGYNPCLYFPVWYAEQSIVFWKEFLREDPGVEIVLENVWEPEPEMLLQIVSGVDDPKFRICLDVGHVNAYGKKGSMEWVETLSPFLSHFHLHNNDGSWDTHSPLDRGTIPMEKLLEKAAANCGSATCTLELQETASSVLWLKERNFL